MTDTTDTLPANHQLAHSDRALPVGAIGSRASGWFSKPYGFADSPYTSIYFVISGFHPLMWR